MRILIPLFLVLSFFFFNSNYIFSHENDMLEFDGWKRIYLATFPRSGNHWARFLIEESTHIKTSSVYRDMELVDKRYPPHMNLIHLQEIFPWGSYSTKEGYLGNCRQPTKNDPIIIKTHFPLIPSQPGDRYMEMLNIRIVRNPIDTCWSFFVHHFSLNQEYPDIVPHQFVLNFIKGWKKFQGYWNHDIECVNVRYEDMLDHPKEILTELMGIIGYNVTEEDIDRAIDKHPPKNIELQHIGHFQKEDLELMKSELKEYLEDFGYQIP